MGTEVETTEHFPLRCHFCSTQRSKLFDKLEKVGPIFLNLNAKDKVLVLLYRSKTKNSKTFNKILSLKHGFGGHGHEFGRFNGFDWFSRYSRFDGLFVIFFYLVLF